MHKIDCTVYEFDCDILIWFSVPFPPGAIIEPAKCRLMSVDEKKDLVRELSKRPQTAPDKLQSWSRRDIVEILCADLGRERKYTGLSKQRMLDYLFRVVTGKSSGPVVHVQEKEPTLDPNASTLQNVKGRVTIHHDCQLLSAIRHLLLYLCQLIMCGLAGVWNAREILNLEDKFCRRCTCCICFQYDDNKGPTLWLFCSSEHPMQKKSFRLSCHLECL